MSALPSAEAPLQALFPAVAKLGAKTTGTIPIVHQTTATDCGAACLAMVLGYNGHHVGLDEVRNAMAVGRDGVTARAIIETAALYGLAGRGVTIELAALASIPPASILFLDFSHFVIFERVDAKGVHVVDPAYGRRLLAEEDARRCFTGVALLFDRSLHFARTAKPSNPIWRHLKVALSGSRELARIALVSVLLQLISLLFPLVQGRMADRVLPRNDLHLLSVLLAGFFATVVFYILASLVRSQLLLYLRTRFDAKLTLGFVHHMLRLPYDFFERRQVGDLQMRVGSVTTVREALTGVVLSGLIDGVLVASHLAFLVVMSVKMTLVALGLVLAQVMVYLLSRRRLMELSGGSIAKQADAANALNELLVGVETLKASGCEQAAAQHWASKHVDVMNINLRRGLTSSVSDALLGALNVIGPVALLVAGTADVLARNIGLGTMLSANAMAVGFIGPMMNLVATLQSLIMIRVHLSRIDDVLSTSPEQSSASKLAPPLRGTIALDRVSFRYGPRLPAVVSDVSLRISAGECVAIVGASGSGKTTLGRILLGLYSPTSGSVRFDGIAVSDLDLGTLRRQLGVVVQRPHVFGTTIRANIALADANLPLDRVEEAAKLAGISEDIAKMPMKYDTPVVAGGASLSGGQRQRIALARALVHRPSVLLLDEATSALDAITEEAVQKNLETLPCTRVFIAHRLSTVIRCDRILVMDQGAIVEQGTHAELLARGGVYARLVAAQLGRSAPAVAAPARGEPARGGVTSSDALVASAPSGVVAPSAVVDRASSGVVAPSGVVARATSGAQRSPVAGASPKTGAPAKAAPKRAVVSTRSIGPASARAGAPTRAVAAASPGDARRAPASSAEMPTATAPPTHEPPQLHDDLRWDRPTAVLDISRLRPDVSKDRSAGDARLDLAAAGAPGAVGRDVDEEATVVGPLGRRRAS